MFVPNQHKFVPSSAFNQEFKNVVYVTMKKSRSQSIEDRPCTVIGATFPVTIQDFRHDVWGMISRRKDLYPAFINYKSDIMKEEKEGVWHNMGKDRH